jgi:protein-S-isoprenylcysteine O-methyltransferase Ste14
VPAYAFAVLAAGWFLWVLPFFLVNRHKQPAKRVDKRAHWGIILVAVAYTILWQGHFWKMQLQPWRLALSVVFFVFAALLSWTGTRALGRQWRVDAGLTADHKLVTVGPYGVVRHPIYASMLCTLCGTGFLMRGFPTNCAAANTNSFNPFFSRSSTVRIFTWRRFFPVPSSNRSGSSSEVP